MGHSLESRVKNNALHGFWKMCFDDLDDHCVSGIALFLGRPWYRALLALMCTCTRIKCALGDCDRAWMDLASLFDNSVSRSERGRASKRLRRGGRLRFLGTLRAIDGRSQFLLSSSTELLRRGKLTLAWLRRKLRDQAPVDIDARDSSGFTLLNLVTAFGHFRGQDKVLLELMGPPHHANPTLGDLDGMAPLMNAAACGDAHKVRLLLDRGERYYSANSGAALHARGAHKEGWAPLCGSAPSERAAFAASRAARRFHGAFTAKEWAQNYGHAECVRLLVQAESRLCHDGG